jgi:Tol biopolymer transport system component
MDRIGTGLLGFLVVLSMIDAGAVRADGQSSAPDSAAVALLRPGEEAHLSNLRQLTFGGENAEAYWSWAGDALIYQSTKRGSGCDQIFLLDLNQNTEALVSTGAGRTTCSYFLPGDRDVIFSSTHLGSAACPPTPDMSLGYTWAVYDSYDIFKRPRGGGDLVRITDTPGYDAEATVGPDGTIVFTSVRDGDLEIYTMSPDGKNVKRLTHQVGYDGGPFFSKDGKKICYRGYQPKNDEEKADYQSLLKRGLVRPGKMEIWVMDADGSNKRQITSNGAANFCPFFHPSGERIIFTSNLGDPRGRNFDVYMIGLDGKNQEQITFESTFDGFPMFSPDGRRIAFCSNRNSERAGETNVFVADWKD